MDELALAIAGLTAACYIALWVEARKERRVAATLHVWEWLEDADVRSARTKILAADVDHRKWTLTEQAAADLVWRKFNVAATYQDIGALHGDMLIRRYYPTIIALWEKIRPHIQERRDNEHRPELALDFELLAEASHGFKKQNDSAFATRNSLRGLWRYRGGRARWWSSGSTSDTSQS